MITKTLNRGIELMIIRTYRCDTCKKQLNLDEELKEQELDMKFHLCGWCKAKATLYFRERRLAVK